MTNLKAAVLAIGFMTVIHFQPEKEAVVRFNQAEITNLYNIIDNSATPGDIRKPLLQKLSVAYAIAWPQPPAEGTSGKTKVDSTKGKKQ